MKRLLGLIALILLVVPVTAAEDFTGKWSGSFLASQPDGSTSNDTIYMNVTHKGTDLSGTAGPSLERQWPLKGKVDGNKLTFEVQSDGPLVKFALNFAEGHLKGDANAEQEGMKLSAKVDLQREK